MRVVKYLVLLLVLASFVSALEIESDVFEALQIDDEVRVIVILEDPVAKKSLFAHSEPDTIKERQEDVLQDLILSESPQSQEADFELKYQYQTINGFSGNITAEGLNKLDDNKVKAVYLDRKVSASLDDTVGIMGGQYVHNISAAGYNITGEGETICVLDSGIDYTHIALGNCNPVSFAQNGTNVSFTSQSSHPYANNEYQIFNITRDGYTNIAVHFQTIGLEAPSGSGDATDRIIISDANNNTLAVYKGNSSDIWSPSAPGDTIYITFVTDPSITNYGFLIDQVINGTTDKTLNWSNCSKIVDGWDFVNSDNDPMDDYGHGTHVAGIVASNDSTYKGVAPDAKLIAMKVLDASGGGYFSDVDAAIDWCTANKAKHNISVITMSLGSSTAYTSACESSSPSTKVSVSGAVGAGIAVIAASGNGGSSTGISSPACLINVTSIGRTSNDDSVFSTSNGNSLLDLLAPGTSIHSTESSLGSVCGAPGGAFGDCSGTSMSAPHAAGAAALLHQYWRLVYGQNITHLESQTKFKRTGLQVLDSRNGLYFPRIDIFAAIQPFINYTSSSTLNNSYIISNNTFINISSDVDLSVAILQWNFSNGSINNFTMTQINTTSFYFNMTHLRDGIDRYKVYGNDSVNTFGVSGEFLITIDQSVPNVNITNPATGVNLGIGFQAFNATVLEANIANVTFSFDNASGNGFNITPTNTSGNWHANLDLSKFTGGTHILTVMVNDSLGNYNTTQSITFTVDRSAPTLSIITPVQNRNFTFITSNQTFNVSVTDANLNVSEVKFSFSNSTGTSFNISATNKSGHWSASYNVSNLADGNHFVTIFANDTASNMNNTEIINFTVDTVAPLVTFVTANGLNFSKTSFNKTFSVNVGDLTAQSVLLSFDNASGTSFNITLLNSTGQWTASYNVSTLAQGSHIITVIANDTHGNLNSSESLTFNTDYTFFTVSNLSSSSITASATTIKWNSSVLANATVHYGTGLSLGSASSSTARNKQHVVSLSSLSASTLYYFNVTSCDFAGNCNSTGTQNFTTSAAATPSSGGSGGGGSGSGSSSGGGGGSASVGAASAATVSTPSSGSPTSQNGAVDAGETAGILFQQTVSVTSGSPTSVQLSRSDISFKQIVINAKVDKEINLEVEAVQEKPVNLPELQNVYQFIKVTAELVHEDLDTVDFTFSVTNAWLQENNYDGNSVKLNVYEQEQWLPLKTTKVTETDAEITFSSKVSHLSYFAITAELVIIEQKQKIWKNKFFLVIASIIILIAVIIIIVVIVRKKEDVY
jgi:PGF-pre-PGF domain-containing protein